MSRQSLERRRITEGRWPLLLSVVQDVTSEGNVATDLTSIIAKVPVEKLGPLLEQWKDWNSGYAWKHDAGAFLQDGFGVDHDSEDDAGARKFMNRIYDAAIQRWRASGGEFKL